MTTKIQPQLIKNVGANNLQLDKQNPRLPEAITKKNDKELWKHMKKFYDLDELALSIQNNGYFIAEPLVVIPTTDIPDTDKEQYKNYINDGSSNYIVVEGNRRLATIQCLLNGNLDYEIDDDTKQILENNLPVIVYPNRNAVLNFLGVRHLAGVRKWDVYERARYIVKLKREKGYSITKIQNIIGDKKNLVKKTYVCYRLIEIVEEYDETFDTKDAKNNFSFLQLATGQSAIREYIGLPYWSTISDEEINNPIPEEKREALKFLFECLFDNKDKDKLIGESRDITKKLSRIFRDDDSIKILKATRKIDKAFDMIGGDFEGMEKLSANAKDKLETANGILSSQAPEARKKYGEKLNENIKAISNIVADILNKR